MRPRVEEFQNFIARLYPELGGLDGKPVRCVTLQVTDGCNLCCTYCYQTCKSHHFMDPELAKRFLTQLLDDRNPYMNSRNTGGIILDLIGGEPLLAIDQIREITQWWLEELIRRDHPWLMRSRVSICSNGTLYRMPKVQAYLRDFAGLVSYTVSVDGDQALHDACRVFPDGSGSYRLAVDAALDWHSRTGGVLSTKMTIAPGNIEHTARAVEHMIGLGYRAIFLNCVFEEGWTLEHGRVLYRELRALADWLFDYKLHDQVLLSIFDENHFRPMEESDNRNWCGGTGDMIAVDWKGDIYPCLRYMDSSLGGRADPMVIGTVDGGVQVTPEQIQRVECLKCVTRRSQSEDACWSCPIAGGCAWCSAYNYQVFGTPDKRATFICVMHRARALANVYFWNRYYQAMGQDKHFPNHVPREWALELVGEAELARLEELARGEM